MATSAVDLLGNQGSAFWTAPSFASRNIPAPIDTDCCRLWIEVRLKHASNGPNSRSWRVAVKHTTLSRTSGEEISPPGGFYGRLSRRIGSFLRVHAQFQKLEETIGRYEEIIWLPPTYEEKNEIAERLRKLGAHSVYIAHTGSQDCYEFAAELSDIFKEAGWAVAAIRPNADPKAHATRSIEVVDKDENMNLVRSVSDAFIGLTRHTDQDWSSENEKR